MRNVLRLLQKLPFQHVRVVRFLFSGGMAVTVNLGFLWILTDLLHMWYLLSAIITVIFGSLVNFLLQKFWTFENHSLKRVHIQLPQFIGLVLLNMALNAFALYVLVEYMHVWYLFGQVICVGTLAIMNYYLYHTHIFYIETENN